MLYKAETGYKTKLDIKMAIASNSEFNNLISQGFMDDSSSISIASENCRMFSEYVNEQLKKKSRLLNPESLKVIEDVNENIIAPHLLKLKLAAEYEKKGEMNPSTSQEAAVSVLTIDGALKKIDEILQYKPRFKRRI